MIRNNKYVKNNINAINTILISNRNINFKIHFISSPSYVAALPSFFIQTDLNRLKHMQKTKHKNKHCY